MLLLRRLYRLQKKETYPARLISHVVTAFILLCLSLPASAQNPKIKCYFNRPVNNMISTGANAVYLNGTFPDTVAAYINRAKYSIDIALYNYTATSGSNAAKLATAVNAAANRGVAVRWIYNGNSSTANSGLSLVNSSVQKFAAPNVTNYIMHNKFMVVDINSPDSNDVVVLTGSYNWSDQQASGDYNNIVFIQSKQVATAFYNEFNKMWGGSGATPNAANSKFGTAKTKSAQTKFNVNGTPIEVYFSPKDSLGDRLQTSINTAQYDLFFGIYAFTDFSLSNDIKNKFNSGVNVRGIMDNWNNGNNAYNNLVPLLGENLKIFTGGGDLYHHKIMLVDPLTPNSDPQVFTGSFNWTTQGQFANDENAVVIHDAAIANQYYQSMCQNFTVLGGAPCVASPCSSGAISVDCNKRGTTYQWQVNTGSGFTDLLNNSNYNGVTSLNLQIRNSPTSWYGYMYRCIVDGSVISDTTTLKFTAYWNGSTSTAWENTANWNCGVLPDANTDVVINPGVKFFPTLNSNTACRSLRLSKNAAATIAAGFILSLTGR